jgi:Spy/CpxP family protein refolding chaperone
MNRTVTRAALALGLAAIVVTGALAFAQGTPPPPQRRPGQMMGRGGPGGPGQAGVMQHLNLTDDQRTKIQSLMEQQRQSHQGEMQKSMMDLQQQLKDAVFADTPNSDAITQAQSQIAALEAQLAADRVAMAKQVVAVLTPDQRKQVRDMPGPGPFMGGRGMGPGFQMGPMHRGRGW